METCEVCGKQQPSCWPVDVNALTGGEQHVKMLCNGCAAMDVESAWAMEMIERTARAE